MRVNVSIEPALFENACKKARSITEGGDAWNVRKRKHGTSGENWVSRLAEIALAGMGRTV